MVARAKLKKIVFYEFQIWTVLRALFLVRRAFYPKERLLLGKIQLLHNIKLSRLLKRNPLKIKVSSRLID